jgi:hypothetical protein
MVEPPQSLPTPENENKRQGDDGYGGSHVGG